MAFPKLFGRHRWQARNNGLSKGFHSIVLLTVCDARYCITMLDIGGVGSTKVASILSASGIGKVFDEFPASQAFSIPKPSTHGDKTHPYVLVGDDIFPLKPWLMKPYLGCQLEESHRVYNYRLSRGRRCNENAFGILAGKWRIFRRPIKGSVELGKKIVGATVCLPNYLRLTGNANYIPAGFVDSEDTSGNVIPGDWRSEVGNDNCDSGMSRMSRQIGGNRYTYEAGATRDVFMEFFRSPEGEVSWQWEHVRNCGRISNNH